MLAEGCETPFTWNYLAGSDLKSSLAYPNGLAASWAYDANNQLLQVCNATLTNTISQHDYVYDAAGRRISVSKSGNALDQADTVAYGYNARSELTNAVAAVDSAYCYSYQFDDIGNRATSSERGTNSVYTANSLNQYTAVDEFTSQFDDDGNQTLIKTSTGIWSVTYNGENRPVLWECVSTNSPTPNSTTPTLISMSYDRMGRRVTKNGQRFVYDGYLQITDNNGNSYVWDPTEKVATRPLVWNSSTLQPFNFSTSYYVHDGNKNVSEVVAENVDMAAHYEYAPFGAVITQCGAFAAVNPWRFSSEYAEDDMTTVYYNYRHYKPATGRWMQRDPIGEFSSPNLYELLVNNSICGHDYRGLFKTWNECDKAKNNVWNDALKKKFQEDSVKGCNMPDIRCKCCKTKSRRGRTTATNERGTKSEIVICVEAHTSEEDVRKTVLHELEHVKDHCKWGVKKFNCNQAICSELWAWKLHGCEHLTGDARRECSRAGVKSSLKGKPACRGVKNLDERITNLFNGCYDR